jgi:hypothetical protein
VTAIRSHTARLVRWILGGDGRAGRFVVPAPVPSVRIVLQPVLLVRRVVGAETRAHGRSYCVAHIVDLMQDILVSCRLPSTAGAHPPGVVNNTSSSFGITPISFDVADCHLNQ